MKIAISSDHAGYELKKEINKILSSLGHEVIDLGPENLESVDYPDYGKVAGEAIASEQVSRAIVVCGSGIGISIAANRNPVVRAALCTSGLMARLARQHNDANVLALGARLIGIETVKDCIHEFLNTPFEGGRHQRRVDKLSQNV